MAAVLDASAIIALVNAEDGQDMVRDALVAGATVCTVNLTEVVTILLRQGAPEIEVRRTIERLPFATADFDNDLAVAAGLMSTKTRQLGLSLGDRACLALARRGNEPALTTDRAWVQAGPLVGVTVKLIR